jgi:hypothetical protein
MLSGEKNLVSNYEPSLQGTCACDGGSDGLFENDAPWLHMGNIMPGRRHGRVKGRVVTDTDNLEVFRRTKQWFLRALRDMRSHLE